MAGIGNTSLDVNTIVTQLMQVERQPLTALQKKEAAITQRIAAVSRIQGGVSALQGAAKTLADTATFSGVRATISGDGLNAAVTDSAKAAPGSYAIKVTRLATAQSLASEQFNASTDVLGNGTLTLQVGSTTKTITIGNNNNTLAGVRDAINAAKAGVSAAIVNDGGKVRLTLLSESTGAANAIKLTVQEQGTAANDPENGDATGLSRLSFDSSITLPGGASTTTGRQMRETRAALDATFEINGLALSSATNKVSGAIEGVSLDLKTASDSAITTVTVGRDTSTMRNALDNFVKAYNDLAKSIRDATAFNATTRSAAALNGDSAVRSLQSQLATALRGRFNGGTSDFATLSEIGVEVGRDGTLSVNSTKFTDAAADPAKLSRFFTTTASSDAGRGIAARFSALTDKLIGTDGLLPSRTKGLQTQIDAIKDQRDRINQKLETTEARLRKQYSALDSQLSSMQSTSNSLANALSALAKST